MKGAALSLILCICPDGDIMMVSSILSFWKKHFQSQGHECLSNIDHVPTCHMLIVCHDLVFIINKFNLNFVPVKHD